MRDAGGVMLRMMMIIIMIPLFLVIVLLLLVLLLYTWYILARHTRPLCHQSLRPCLVSGNRANLLFALNAITSENP